MYINLTSGVQIFLQIRKLYDHLLINLLSMSIRFVFQDNYDVLV